MKSKMFKIIVSTIASPWFWLVLGSILVCIGWTLYPAIGYTFFLGLGITLLGIAIGILGFNVDDHSTSMNLLFVAFVIVVLGMCIMPGS